MASCLFRMLITKLCLIVLVVDLSVVVCLTVRADSETVNSEVTFRFANIYGDHMVLQAKPFSAMVWGFGEVGQVVEFRMGSFVQTTTVLEGNLMLLNYGNKST